MKKLAENRTLLAFLGVAIVFMEEKWARNLAQLFASPLRPIELVAALAIMSFARTLIGVLPAALLALPLFHVSVFALGLPLAGFFANLLVFGWSVGLVIAALVLRLGLGAESLAWVAVFAIAPLCGVYYPIDALPVWLQPLSWALPPAYIFEGMRAILFDHRLPAALLLQATLINTGYFIAAIVFFLRVCHVARQRGLLLTQGE